MTKPFNEAPPLFRSLGADNAKSQARSRTAASEAQERWPLFKAVAPVKPASLPAMGEDDKRQWARGAAAGNAKPRPALSVPDVSGKMALGLTRMGSPRPPARTERAFAPPAAPAAVPVPALDPVSTTPAAVPAARAPLFARTAPLQDTRAAARALPEAPAELPLPAARPKGLFAHLAPPAPQQAPAAAPAADPDDRSLSAIFNRLERGAAPAPARPSAASDAKAPPRAGFLGRLGRQ